MFVQCATCTTESGSLLLVPWKELPPAEAEEVCPSAFCPQLALNLLGDTVQLSVMHTQIHTRVHTLTLSE